MPEETSANSNAEEAKLPPNPDAGEADTPEVAKQSAPSSSESQATELPTGNAPDPKADNPDVNPDAAAQKSSDTAKAENSSKSDESKQSEKATQAKSKPDSTKQEATQEKSSQKENSKPDSNTKDSEESKSAKPAAKSKADSDDSDSKDSEKKDKPAAKADKKPAADKSDQKPAAKGGDKKGKKERPPAVEDKPFPEFIQQDYLPALESALSEKNLQDIQLSFEKNQVTGRWNHGNREFMVYFPQEDIKESKAFSLATGGREPSTIEPFLIDERKITLDLLVFGVIQRLNGQKWFGNN